MSKHMSGIHLPVGGGRRHNGESLKVSFVFVIQVLKMPRKTERKCAMTKNISNVIVEHRWKFG